MSELIKRQDAINAVMQNYRYESDRMTALQELPATTEEKIRNEAITNYSAAVLSYVKERANPMFEGNKEVGKWVRLSEVEKALNKYLNTKKQTIKLEYAGVGDIVEIEGIRWCVYNISGDIVYCITEDIQFNAEFDEKNNNNWKESSLRRRLNTEFIKNTFKNNENYMIIEHISDLTSDDGLKQYGQASDKVYLITEEDYRKYRKYIKKVGSPWWTITPDSPINNYAHIVDADGTLDYHYAYSGGYGVRPACAFRSSIDSIILKRFKEDEEDE